MSTRSYRLIDEHASPVDFVGYIADTIRRFDFSESPVPLHLKAQRIVTDELSLRRGDPGETIEIDFMMESLSFSADHLVVNGHIVRDDSRTWLQIFIDQEDVEFDLLD
tara:strand:- start:71 stop:394 length:324 start_codon:yes stop_codon:yes gene_type:complete